MIVGAVRNLEAIVPITFHLTNQQIITIEFVVDTGFAGALTLPHTTIATLGLPYLQEMTASLADDNSVKTDVHVATILWGSSEKRVAVLAMGQRPLLGTSLLSDQNLNVDFNENGSVIIDEI
jgi:clan AA aspartic protease